MICYHQGPGRGAAIPISEMEKLTGAGSQRGSERRILLICTQPPVELTQRASTVSKTQPLRTQGKRFKVIKNWSCPIPKGHLDKYALGRHD